VSFNYPNCAIPFKAIPVINAPMDTVCSVPLLNTLYLKQLPTTVHRFFKDVEEQIKFLEGNLFPDQTCFVAVGIMSKWKDWIDKLIAYRFERDLRFGLLVDVANGDTRAVVDTIKYIKERPLKINVMAGNVATKSGFSRLQDAGADFIRVGIGGSGCCSTRNNVGFGLPTLTSIWDCGKVKSTSYLVADGGIEGNGDIVKAVAAGADLVMCGKMFAATDLANNLKYDKDMVVESHLPYGSGFVPKYCQYRGMASRESIEKLNSKKTSISIEGVEGLIPYQGKTEEVIKGMIGNLQSAVAYYGGCRNWDEFRRKVKFVEITSIGWEESKTRVL